MKKTLSTLLTTLALAAGLSSAQAAPVTWSFQNVGAAFIGTNILGHMTLTGSFDFDATTGLYSNVDVDLAFDGYAFASFDTADVQAGSSATQLLLLEVWGDAQFYFAAPLTGAGGTLAFTGGLGSQTPFLTNLVVTGAGPATTSVPEPGSLAIVALALAALGLARRPFPQAA